jgi:hypothetical protein
VARHERCYERHQKVLELDHYLDALTKKPGALAGSTALEQGPAAAGCGVGLRLGLLGFLHRGTRCIHMDA